MTQDWISDSEVDTFLELLDLSRGECNIEFLVQIISKTIERIPFQNLTMLSNTREVPTWEDIKKQMLSAVGGICTVRNPFIHQILLNLGFDAKLVAATIMQPDCHIAIIVRINNEDWWCDPGNGFPYFSLIKLGDESVKSHPFLNYRLVEVNDRWELQHLIGDNDWYTNYHFDLKFVELDYFEHTYLQHYTVPGYGPFLTGIRFNKWSEEDWIILRDKKATTHTMTVELHNEDELNQWIEENIHPIQIDDFFGANSRISKIWEVVV
tara:strand:+ start:1452 stop:2249 length:798 start_codon:yes stop_codon:yes gene_type:complete